MDLKFAFIEPFLLCLIQSFILGLDAIAGRGKTVFHLQENLVRGYYNSNPYDSRGLVTFGKQKPTNVHMILTKVCMINH